MNYTLEEYASDIIYNVMDVCDDEKVPHPNIVSESGRAIVAHHSVLVVQAFGAVAIGRFSSLPLTYLGGLVIGLLAAIGTKYLSAHPPLNGIPAVVPFLVLIVVMLFTPPRLLPKGAGRREGAMARVRASTPWRRSTSILPSGSGPSARRAGSARSCSVLPRISLPNNRMSR